MSQRYLLLPQTGLRSQDGPDAEHLSALRRVYEHEAGAPHEIDGVTVRVLDAAHEGPALVAMNTDDAERLARGDSSLRVLPEVIYPHPLPLARRGSLSRDTRAAASVEITITCVDAHTGTPLAGLYVAAVSDGAAGIGAEAQTDAHGKANLLLPAGRPIERLHVRPSPGYWGACHDAPALADHCLRIAPLDLAVDDVLRHYYPPSEAATRFDRTTGVIVGVIDTGVGPHADLTVDGICTVTGLPARDYADVSAHGTHVAGLIGASGAVTAIAPGVALRAYRVFPDALNGATNYAIVKAMMRAAQDRCDIVNLSLGGGPADPVVAEAMSDARNNGMLVVAAAGNDGRPIVSYPAAHPGVIAVAAFGRRGLFPSQSAPAADVRDEPVGSDPDEFVARFSNTGACIAVIAPGVGVVSTLPNGAYGPLSGTSMAAPVVSGVAACLLSRDRELFAAPRNRARSDALAARLLASCVSHGFGAAFEGKGRPRA